MALEHSNHLDWVSNLSNLENMTVQGGEARTSAEGISSSTEQKTKRKTRQRPCRFFARGKCQDGEKCKFSHIKKLKKPNQENAENVFDADIATVVEDTAKAPILVVPDQHKKTRTRKCKYFAWNKCRNGDKCKFSHERKKGGTNTRCQRIAPELPPHAVVVLLGAPIESANTVNKNSSEWSDEQQHALDQALKKYPATMEMEERWTSIANEVDGRSLNECIDRFKMLCELVRSGVDPTTMNSENDSPDDPTDNTKSEQCTRNTRITPLENRVPIATEPEVKGTRICLEDLFLHEVGTLVAHELVCQVQCNNCPLTFDASLSLDLAEIQRWCPRCSALHHLLMRPVFAHSQSDVLAYVDTENCSIIDVLPSNVLATCLECGCETLLQGAAPSQRSEQACFSCHTKLAVMSKRFVARQLEGLSRKQNNSPDDSVMKPRAKKFTERFVLGQPLPRYGACNHYRHSLRWFRFQCCGKAFPCNVCHDSSDCPKANMGILASRMICGLCSKEQSSSVKVCSCGNDVASKKTTTHHWEGGTGCRNYFLMSRWDKQKHRGQNKTESTKCNRVGMEAKKRRETANKQLDTLRVRVQ